MRCVARIIDIVRKIPVLFLALACSIAAADFGPPTGSRFPAFSLPDQGGKLRSLHSLLGPKGAVILFYRSAAGCPYCKAQLDELERHQEAFHRLGVGVAAVSNDSTAILKDFAGHTAIHFPLLSDSTLKTIQSLHILNGGAARPGWFVLDAKGVVKAKYFEEDPNQSYTSAGILLHQFGWTPPEPTQQVEGKQLTATIGASNSTVAPGQRVTLTLDIDLQPNLHVYAPGVDNYIPIEWKMDDSDAALVQSMVTRIFSVDELIPEAKEAFLAGAFGFSKAYAIVKGPKEDQHRKLAEVLAGASRDDVERKGRIGRGKNPDAKKLSRVRIVSPNGESVVVCGSGLNMARLADVLTQALKEVRKAAPEHDVKSFASMQRVRRERG